MAEENAALVVEEECAAELFQVALHSSPEGGEHAPEESAADAPTAVLVEDGLEEGDGGVEVVEPEGLVALEVGVDEEALLGEAGFLGEGPESGEVAAADDLDAGDEVRLEREFPHVVQARVSVEVPDEDHQRGLVLPGEEVAEGRGLAVAVDHRRVLGNHYYNNIWRV